LSCKQKASEGIWNKTNGIWRFWESEIKSLFPSSFLSMKRNEGSAQSVL